MKRCSKAEVIATIDRYKIFTPQIAMDLFYTQVFLCAITDNNFTKLDYLCNTSTWVQPFFGEYVQLLFFLFCLSVFCVLCPILPLPPDCPFQITPSIFSNVYSEHLYLPFIYDNTNYYHHYYKNYNHWNHYSNGF